MISNIVRFLAFMPSKRVLSFIYFAFLKLYVCKCINNLRILYSFLKYKAAPCLYFAVPFTFYREDHFNKKYQFKMSDTIRKLGVESQSTKSLMGAVSLIFPKSSYTHYDMKIGQIDDFKEGGRDKTLPNVPVPDMESGE